MTTSKKNFLLEFSDITEAEASGIIKLVRHPNIVKGRVRMIVFLKIWG
jgi:hypothetical protein